MPHRDVELRPCRLRGRPIVAVAVWGVPLLGVLLLVAACTQERVTAVVVASVTIAPPTVSAFDGEELRLSATVRDEDGVPVAGARVAWSSDDRSIVTVDADGTARARAVGTTTVRASFQDVSGSATFVVLRAPSLAVSRDSVALFAGAGASGDEPEVLEVSNDGGGMVEHLAVEVAYPPTGPADWLDVASAGEQVPTTLTLSPRADGLAVGTYAAVLTLTAEGASNSPLSVPVTLSLTGLRITQSDGGTSVAEADGRDEFTVVLALRPASDVVVNVVSSDTGEARVSPTRLTFSPSRWDEPQTVRVTGADDPLIDGDQVTEVALTLEGGSGSAGMGEGRVLVTTVDDDEASLGISERGGSTTVAESGTTDDFTVVLGAQPTSDVVLRLASTDPGEAQVVPTTLRLTPADWNDPRTVTVRGVDDDLIDGDQAASVTIAVDEAQSDDAFDAIADRSVRTTTLDGDVPGLAISETGGGTYVTEAGSRDRFTVALTAGPGSDVVLNVSSADGGELAAAPGTLRFTPANWDEPQTVAVTGVDDGVDDGDASTDVIVAVDDAASHDAFDALAARSLRVTTTDNDGYGITVTETDGATMLSEAGGQDVLAVVLDRAPWFGDVVIDVIVDAGEVVAPVATLRFTRADWNVTQTLVLTGVDDSLVDGDQATLITFDVNDAASDVFYQFVSSRAVTAITVDDDDGT